MSAPVMAKSGPPEWRCPVPGCNALRRYDAYRKHLLDAHNIYAPIFTRMDPKTDLDQLDEAVLDLVCKPTPVKGNGKGKSRGK